MSFFSWWNKLAKYQVLFLRIALLFVVFAHGWAKLTWWVERRTGLGEAMWMYWITMFPWFRWFMAAYAESIAIGFIALGILTRFNAFLLAFTMLTAIMTKVLWDPGIERLSELSAAFYIFVAAFAILLSWAGKIFNNEHLIFGKKSEEELWIELE